MIPGVTAALGAAAYCGVALTHRDRSSSVAFCTGHAEPIPVPAVDTIVYYMAAASLPRVAAAVLAAGWRASTPVLIVRNATLPDQHGTLTSLERIRAGGAAPPHPAWSLSELPRKADSTPRAAAGTPGGPRSW